MNFQAIRQKPNDLPSGKLFIVLFLKARNRILRNMAGILPGGSSVIVSRFGFSFDWAGILAGGSPICVFSAVGRLSVGSES